MHRSSESIGAIAAALAKAQAELVNPEKSLVGIIGPSSPRDSGRAFRYAPLSSGLDIVRKSLGRHAIAILQTTAIDKDARLVRLNTVLAHSSGEWVSSEWPVCPIGVRPRRNEWAPRSPTPAGMHYSRWSVSPERTISMHPILVHLGNRNLVVRLSPTANLSREEMLLRITPTRGRKCHPRTPKMLLEPDASAVLRERLIIELAAIATADEAVTWAQRSLPAKNTLASADADVIEQAFRVKMHSVERIENDKATSPAPSGDQLDKFDTQPGLNAPKLDTGLPPDIVPSSDGPKLAPMEDDQNAIALTKPVRKRDKAHRDFVCSQPCLICGRRPSDAHHIRFGQPRALGRKVSDEFTVPLCRVHHRDLHRGSDEKKWWEAAKIEPMEIAQRLWRETRDKMA